MIVYARFSGLAASFEYVAGSRFLPTTFPERQVVPVFFRHAERLDGACELTRTESGLLAAGHVLLDDSDPASAQAYILRCIRAGILTGLSTSVENGIADGRDWTSARVREVTITGHPLDWRCRIDKWNLVE